MNLRQITIARFKRLRKRKKVRLDEEERQFRGKGAAGASVINAEHGIRI